MPVLNYLAFLNLLVANAALIAPLFELAQAVYSAPTLADKWAALKSLGDLLVPAIEKMPGTVVSKSVELMNADELADYHAEVAETEQAIFLELNHLAAADGTLTSQAWDGSKLKKIFEVVQLILPLLLAIKG